MMRPVKATIIIPCFRNESTIFDVLSDIRCQTCSAWELLVVGNGPCQEAQRKIVEAASYEDERIKYLSIEKSGVSRARNLGIEKASGDWIAFVDADDRVPSQWLGNLLSHVSREPDVVAGGISYRDKRSLNVRRVDLKLDSEEIYCNDAKKFVPIFLSDIAVTYSPCTKIFRTKFLMNSGIMFREDISVYEDGIFNLEIAKACSSMCFIRQTGYEYCLHPSTSAIGRYHACMPEAVGARRKLTESVMSRGGFEKNEIEHRIAAQLAADALDVFLNVYRPGSPAQFSSKVKLVREIFANEDVACAWRVSRPTMKNLPLLAFWFFYAIRSPFLCVMAFHFLFFLRKLWR